MLVKLTPESFDKIQQTYEEALRERAKQIKALKDDLGWSFRKIGEYFGVSKQAAANIYKNFKDEDDNRQ